jgi:hypothetical protein
MNFVNYKSDPGDKFMYLQKSTKQLNLNDVVNLPISVFPKDMYKTDSVFAPPIYDSDVRDLSTVYMMAPGKTHPLTFSKFDYPGCEFGYCYGPQSGRNYGLPPWCHLRYPARTYVG